MHLRPTMFVAALAIAVARVVPAQEVRVEVVELATGKPVVGANVTLLADSTSMGGSFSDGTGHTALRVPFRGAYRVRADKVGYDTWTSVVLQVGLNPIHVRIGLSPTRNPTAVVARSETACQQLTSGTPAGDLWVEIRKALAATALTESQGLAPLDVDIYERVLDRNSAVITERTEQRARVARRPATGISADQLDSTRRAEVSGDNVYRSPDAATLLSDQFVKSHCFAAIRGYGPEAGLNGLEFRPSKLGGAPDLTGVLWLDPAQNALKSLAFDYVNLPIPLRVARTTGRLEFQQLPGGQWIVPRWYIRMPRVAQIISSDPRSPAVARDTLLGYQEVGGSARPAGTAAPSLPSAAPSASSEPSPTQSQITGVVYDSTSGMALRDVRVTTGGGRFKTMTSAGGRYALAVDGPLSDTLLFDHPRLRLFHVAGRVQTISLPSGAQGHASLIIPSYGTLRRRLCGQNEAGTEAQGMAVGFVRDAAGNPIANAHVWATWQILWVEQNGRLVSTNQQRTVETDTQTDGSYMLCGFTRGAKITAKVGMAGRGTVQSAMVLPASMVLEHDFVVGSR